jgi:hypothetical protein
MAKADKLRVYIAHKQEQIDDLEKRYGTGVRPSWVGEEIMILIHYQRDAEDQLAYLEKNNATD